MSGISGAQIGDERCEGVGQSPQVGGRRSAGLAEEPDVRHLADL
ncbi:hypothetical protein [Amycolatopsis regifaucium]|nr:hypothetical protein [Amycolatopsis regifaucium]